MSLAVGSLVLDLKACLPHADLRKFETALKDGFRGEHLVIDLRIRGRQREEDTI